MNRKILMAVLTALIAAGPGCTMALHENRQTYWTMKDDIRPLPCITVKAPAGYISYPLLLERKRLFKAVAEEDAKHPVSIEVVPGVRPADNLALSFLWLLASGSSAFLIPMRLDQPRTMSFIVSIGGQPVKTYSYEDTKTTVIWTLALPLLRERNEEYYVEELIADQFVNSFIIDLLKDQELVARLRNAA